MWHLIEFYDFFCHCSILLFIKDEPHFSLKSAVIKLRFLAFQYGVSF
ncbi:hypothetical protein PMCN01_1383 [Pasteurella multocida subsp. multocida HB01]|nr:hypothetical protein Pmu_14050 [Pasteurella multocida 36950]ANJ90605.1 hypothetical protein PMCN01_1383 [Pasteurella multocida subsp. multocida HB01]